MLGLCICYYNHNFGSMLQAYATVREIERLGESYDILAYKKEKTPAFLAKNAFRVFNKCWVSEKKLLVQKRISRKLHPAYDANVRIRENEFRAFQKNRFDAKVRTCNGYPALQKAAEDYSAVIVGSDQMWSPSGLATNFYNLNFVPEHIRKISYAASFGVSEIPGYQKKRTAAFLNRIEHLSVRENAGAGIIDELTGRKAEVVVDPTMLLGRDEWDAFSGQERVIEEPYIFAYFLGANQVHRRYVSELSRKKNLKVVTLRHLDEYVPEDESFGDFAPYDIGPEKFVNLIKNAEYVCTDSFHGSVFSSIFHKAFLTFSRYSDTSKTSKNSRISSLLENLGLQERHFAAGDIEKSIDAPIDYEKVEMRRKRMIEHSVDFLKQALK